MSKKDSGRRPPRRLPKPTEVDPEDVAFALLNTPPKREDEWRYLKEGKRKSQAE